MRSRCDLARTGDVVLDARVSSRDRTLIAHAYCAAAAASDDGGGDGGIDGGDGGGGVTLVMINVDEFTCAIATTTSTHNDNTPPPLPPRRPSLPSQHGHRDALTRRRQPRIRPHPRVAR